MAEVTKLSNAFVQALFPEKQNKATRMDNSLKVYKLATMNVKTQQRQREWRNLKDYGKF